MGGCGIDRTGEKMILPTMEPRCTAKYRDRRGCKQTAGTFGKEREANSSPM
jgi:hypothetical protein